METCASCHATMPRGSRVCPRCATPAAAHSEDLLASPASDPTGLLERLRAATTDEFTVVRELGRGGMGRVFLAHERALDRRVAIKVLPPDLAELPDVAQRFQREARTAGKLNHPHIMPVYQVLERGGLHLFTMPFVVGPSLRQMLKRTPRLPIEQARRYLSEAADALYHAHAQGVVHRDIKPENMLLEGGPGGRLLLTDFGIAKAIGLATTTLTRPGEMMGTPYYMAPEACDASGAVDGRADQYSLGLVAYEMLAGRFPLTADSLAGIVYKHLHEYPEPLETLRPDAPPDLCRAIARAIRKDPDERFPSMRELRDAVDVGRSRRAPLRSPARRALAWAMVIAVTLAAVAGGSLIHGRLSERGVREGLVADGAAAGNRDAVATPAETPVDSIVPAASDSGPVAPTEPSVDERPSPAGASRGAGAASEQGGDAAVDSPAASDATGSPPAVDTTAIATSRPLPVQDSAASALTDRPAEGGVPVEEESADSMSPDDPLEEPPTESELPAIGYEEAIYGLLEAYRRAIEAEDRSRLESEVYRGPIPERDEADLIDIWFGAGEDFAVSLDIQSLERSGDSAVVRLRQRMAYRLELTGEARDDEFAFLLHFREGGDGWRLARIERSR